jgi:hypothetical protein
MVMVLLMILLGLVVAITVMANVMSSASSTLSVQTKDETFNAAETGVDHALYQLDANHSLTGVGTPGTVDGYTYNWEIVKNNIGGANPQAVSEADPSVNGQVTVGANQAYIAGWASSITGGRTVYSEEIVAAAPPTTLTPGAIVAGQTAQISHEQITDISGHHSANVYGGTITSSGGGQVPDGNSYASCDTSGCNAITGYNGQAYIGYPPPTFLTASELASIQSSALTASQSGGANKYVNGNWSGAGTWGTSTADGNCTVYINGNVTLSGNGTLTNYCDTTVVTGNWTMSGNVQYTIAPTSSVHATYILGTGGATFNGTTNTAGFIYAANGPITLNGGGNGSFTGVLYTPYTVTMNGGGNANFYYTPAQSNVQLPNPNFVAISQWEY